MTTPDKNDDLRDPRFDAEWRNASREEPPASLDATILAAARREAGSGPRSLETREATSTRRWSPLAIAATLGAVTFGLLQLVSTDRVGAPALEKAVVSDMPAQVAKPAQGSSASSAIVADDAAAPAASAESRQRSAAPAAAPRTQPPASQATKPKPNAEFAPSPPSAASSSAGRPPPPTEEPHRRRLPAPESMADKREDARADSSPLPQAFPSAPAPAPSAPALAPSAPSPGASAPAVSAQPATPASPAPEPGVATAPAGAAAPVPARSEPSPSIGTSAIAPSFAPQRAQESGAARVSPQVRSYPGRVADNTEIESPRKERAALSVPDWIALIRRLRAEGNIGEAAKELAAFRTAHLDHEKLLPPDLRDWHPPPR